MHAHPISRQASMHQLDWTPFKEVERLLNSHLQSWHQDGILTNMKNVSDCLEDLFRSELGCAVPHMLTTRLQKSTPKITEALANADVDRLCVVILKDVVKPIYDDSD